MKVRHKGMVVKKVATPYGTRFRVPGLSGDKLYRSEVAARRAIGRVRARGRK